MIGRGQNSGDERDEVGRTPQECFDQSTAPVREFVADSWEAFVGLSAVASVIRFTGSITERRGLILRAFKGRPVMGRAMATVGGATFAAATVPVIAVVGTAAAYFAATSLICDVSPGGL
jgi:hypothetical protein